MDMMKTRENELLGKMDELISCCDRDGLFSLEQKTTTTVLKKINPVIRKNLIICAAEREESVYMKDTIFSAIDSSLAVSPTIQLSHIYDNIARYLLRFANDFPEDYLQEVIAYFLNNNISGDLISRVCLVEDAVPEKVLPDIAMRMIKDNVSATLRIYKALQLQYKKTEYYLAAALIYMELGNFATAYKVLDSAENKTPEIEKIMDNIKLHLN